MLAQLGLDVIEADLVSTSVLVSVGERSDTSRGPTDATASSLTRNLRPSPRSQSRAHASCPRGQSRTHACGLTQTCGQTVATFSLLNLRGDSGM